MRRAALLLMTLMGCTSRERALRGAIRETFAAYEGSPDRYEVGRCEIAPLTGEDQRRFAMEHVFEPANPELATCEVTFHFAEFPARGGSRPIPTRVRFVWLHNASRWVQWW